MQVIYIELKEYEVLFNMHGDVMIFKEKHKRLGKEISERLINFNKEKYIISISGESGTGKSELAYMTSYYLKKQKIYAKILHIDNYYTITPNKRKVWRKENGMENVGLNEINWEMLNENIKAFKEGKKASLPFIDLLTNQVDILTTDFCNIRILIIEGLYSLQAEADLKIFIDSTFEMVKDAQIARGKEEISEYRFKILKREHEVIESIKDRADIIITTDFQIDDKY